MAYRDISNALDELCLDRRLAGPTAMHGWSASVSNLLIDPKGYKAPHVASSHVGESLPSLEVRTGQKSAVGLVLVDSRIVRSQKFSGQQIERRWSL